MSALTLHSMLRNLWTYDWSTSNFIALWTQWLNFTTTSAQSRNEYQVWGSSSSNPQCLQRYEIVWWDNSLMRQLIVPWLLFKHRFCELPFSCLYALDKKSLLLDWRFLSIQVHGIGQRPKYLEICLLTNHYNWLSFQQSTIWMWCLDYCCKGYSIV